MVVSTLDWISSSRLTPYTPAETKFQFDLGLADEEPAQILVVIQ